MNKPIGKEKIEFIVMSEPPKSNKRFLFNKNDIISGVAKWGVAQSPYHRPDKLEIVLDKLNEIITPFFVEAEKKNLGFIEMTYEEIKDFVFKHTTSIPEFEAWNEPKIDTGNPFQGSSSRYHTTKPDYNFIDLHALARNVANDIIREGKETPIPLILKEGVAN